MPSLTQPTSGGEAVTAEKWQDPRIRTLCQDCGHPRSDHHSIYNAIAGDYIYTHCKDDACACDEFMERPEKNIPPPRRLTFNNPAKDTDLRCKACGSFQKEHVYLGPECVSASELNWKMLDILRRHGVIIPAKI